MRRAPSSRTRQTDGLRNSVFDAAHSIGLADPNALRWLEQNSNISEEDEEEEEVQREPRPPSDTHPPSLVFSTSSSEPDSSVHSPSNDHSTNFRPPYRPGAKTQYQAYTQPQFLTQASQSYSQLQVDTRQPIDPNARNSPNPLGRPSPPSLGLKIPDPWPPTQLAIASLAPSPSVSRAPTPADTINSKQATEPRKGRKLTKAPRVDVEPEIVPARKGSAGGESGSSGGMGGMPPTLPFLPFPSSISGEALSSDASVSGLSAISGSSSGTVTQSKMASPEQSAQSIMFPPTPTVNEPRSVFEDDNDEKRPTFSTIPFSSTTVTSSNHTHNSPSTSTAASTDIPNTNAKEGKESKGGILRTMRSFKLSLKGQKAPKIPLPEAPPVPNVPSLPPVLTLKLGKGVGAGIAEGLQDEATAEQKRVDDKEREARTLRVAEMFKPSESGPNVSSIYSTQLQRSESGARSDLERVASDQGHLETVDQQSEQDHAPIRVAGGGGFWSADVGSKKAWTAKPPKAAKPRRMSVNQATGIAEPPKETIKVTEKTRAGTVGMRNGHARTRSKSGDFSGAGWEKTGRPAATKATKGAKGPKPVVVKRIANPDPISPKMSFDSEARHSLERVGFGARGEHDEMRALDVQHQLQSFVASMRGAGGEDAEEEERDAFSRASEESFNPRIGPRGKGDDSDTLRSSGEYDPDPFRAFGPPARSVAVPLPRPESEAIPHRLVIPAHSIPKELGQTSASTLAPTPKRAIPPIVSKSPENGPPAGQAQVSTSVGPSIVVGAPGEQSPSANKPSEVHSRGASQGSEFGLGYSKVDSAPSSAALDVGDNYASEDWVVPSPSWAPLDPKRGRSPAPDAVLESPQPKFLGVRPERQRASGLSIPRSVTPDSPMPVPAQARSVTPLVAPRSVTPMVAPSPRSTPLGGVRPSFVPLVARSLTPQPRDESPSQGREPTPPNRQAPPPSRYPRQLEERNSPSPPISRRTLPVRTSSISSVSSGDLSLSHGSRVRSPPPRIVVPAPVPGPRSAQPAFAPRSMTSTPIPRSATSTPISRAPVPRSMSTTPTPRANEEEQSLRHEAFSRFLAPETIPSAQKRGRVSPFPTRPVREQVESWDRASSAASAPKTSWEAPEESQPNQREKYPGGADKYGSDGLMQVPRVRFIGVRSSNGSSQAGWQGRMEDMRNEGPSPRTGSWIEYEEDGTRPVSWEGGLAYDEDPINSTYDETTQQYDQAVRDSAYTEEPQEDDMRRAMSPDATSDVGPLRPSDPRYPGWTEDAPASRASTFTVASVYDDEEPIPPVPNTQKLAATIRGMGMGQSTWARGRI